MKRNIYIDFTYLIILAATFGGVMVLGVLVAPVIFYTDGIIVDVVLDRYNSGIIMAEIFSRFATWLYVVVFIVLSYEAIMYKMGQKDRYLFVGAFLVVFSSLMFSGVYVPKILAMQDMGREATQSDTFATIHAASEIDFKILAVGLLVLFVRRLMLLSTKAN